MRLIFLSWACPPMEFPRAVQVERLARHVALRPVEIVCAATGADDAAAGIAVSRIPEPPRLALYRRLGLARLHAALVVPDAARAWSVRAMRHVARTAPAPDDVLVTFGQPMSDHLAGLALKARFGLRWIAHLSDPWADNPLNRAPFYRARNLGLERRVVAACDRVLVTSPETLELVMRKYPPAWRGKAMVLPHAFEPDLYPPPAPAAARGRLVLRYLGSLYGERSPLPFLRGLELLARRDPGLAAGLAVEFIGETAPRLVAASSQAGLPADLVRFLPGIPYRQSLAAMRAADLLLHVDAPAATSVFLASKLVDYIGARRPILGVTPAGTAARLIAAMGGWVADPGAPEQIAAALAAALAHVAANRGADWGDDAVRRRFEIGVVAREFADIVEQVRGGADPCHPDASADTRRETRRG